jgi:exosome complex exonuclease DIS3/RRP44
MFLTNVDVGMYQVREANQMVEEFMLAANMSVAERILKEFPSCSLLRYVELVVHLILKT